MKFEIKLSLAVFLSVLFANGAVSASSTADAELIFQSRLHSPNSTLVKVKIKKKESGTFDCWTDSIPPHRLIAPGFKKLKAPFSSGAVSPLCDEQVWWLEPGKKEPSATACYERGRFPVLDQIFQSCLNI